MTYRGQGRPRFVSFSGVDGAGKSTQIEALSKWLQEAGLRVRIITFWDNIAQLTGMREEAGHRVFKGEKGVGSPDKPVNRRDKNVQSWPMSCVRLGLYTLDALATRAAVKKALRSDTDFIIFDRYIYDELANLNLKNPVMRAFVRAVMKVVPTPDVGYVLDADPAQARARKPEYPVEFIVKNRQRYMDLNALIGGITVIPPGPLQDMKREVLMHALRTLPAQAPVEMAEEDASLQRAS